MLNTSSKLLRYTGKMTIPIFTFDVKARETASPLLQEFLNKYDGKNIEEVSHSGWERTKLMISLGDWAIVKATEAFEKGDYNACSYAADVLDDTRNSISQAQQLAITAHNELMVRHMLTGGRITSLFSNTAFESTQANTGIKK
jgi:hypothetical protein